MNKASKTLMALTAAVLLSFNAAAKHNGGGFTGPSDAKTSASVADAKKMSDDTYVILRGKIVKSIGDEKYLFEDKTGSIVVEIDDDDWGGLSVGPENTVEIRGEVDTHWDKPADIDVDSITIVQ